MGILFTILMGFLFTITMGKLFTIAVGIQLTISNNLCLSKPTPSSVTYSQRRLASVGERVG